MYHTIGQRQGLGIGGVSGASEAPWYVAGKDLERNVLIVVQGTDHPMLYSRSLVTSAIHWINGEPDLDRVYGAKTRYRQPDQPCRVEKTPGGYRVKFDEPQRAVTPGQSAVLYDGDICLGGGVIEEAGDHV